MSEPGVVRKLVSHLSRSSGEVLRKNPRLAGNHKDEWTTPLSVCRDSSNHLLRSSVIFIFILSCLSPLSLPSFSLLWRCLPKNCSAVVELELSRPVCVELYQDYKELGRFMLRNAGKTIAAGIVTKVRPLYWHNMELTWISCIFPLSFVCRFHDLYHSINHYYVFLVLLVIVPTIHRMFHSKLDVSCQSWIPRHRLRIKPTAD